MSTTEISSTEVSLTEQIVKAHAEAAIAAELAAKPPVDFQTLYQEKVEEVDRLNAVITAGRIAASAPANKSHKPVITTQRLRAMVGDATFLGMSRTEKLVALGVDPKVSDDVLRKGWGRGNDGQFGSDLMKTNPREYGLLKEAAIALNIYGK
jgi:hypothetical protein